MTRPGISVLPVPSMVRHGAWHGVELAEPSATMRPSRTTTVWLSRAGVPVPLTTRTLVIANVGVSTTANGRTAVDIAGRWASAAIDALDANASACRNMTQDTGRRELNGPVEKGSTVASGIGVR